MAEKFSFEEALQKPSETFSFEDALKPQEASIGKRFASSFERAGTSIGTGVKAAIGTPEEAAAAAKAGAAEQERISRETGRTRGFDEVKDIYQREGFLPAAGEFVSQIPGAVAEQGANIAGTLGAGFAGAKVGSLAGPIGATIGGITGAAAYLYPQFFGANLEEQARVAQEQKKPLELDRGSAAIAATGQTALEAGGTAFTLGKNLISKLIGKEVSKELAEKQLLEGTASSQVITHYLKLGTTKQKIEMEILEKQKELIEAKTESLQSAKRIEELYKNALDAMKNYSGHMDESDEDDDEY